MRPAAKYFCRVMRNCTTKRKNPRRQKDRRFVRNVDNSRYRSSHRMQFHKPFRLRGPLGVASNAPLASPLPPCSPIVRSAPAIYQPRSSPPALARSPASLPRCLSSSRRSLPGSHPRALRRSFAISTSFLRIAIAPSKQR